MSPVPRKPMRRPVDEFIFQSPSKAYRAITDGEMWGRQAALTKNLPFQRDSRPHGRKAGIGGKNPMNDNVWAIAQLDSRWRPWSVPRIAKRTSDSAPASRAGVLAKWLARNEPTPFQRCLAIHIVNATFPDPPETDQAA
jgi:hypothetical protein